MEETLIRVGEYIKEFNEILGIDIKATEIYRSKGLPTHMIKSKHYEALKYIDFIPEIIDNPDYIGVNPNENNSESIELIKRYKDNILIGIKLDKDKNYLYVSTMHEVQDGKIQRRLHSGRIKEFKVDRKGKLMYSKSRN